MTFAELLEQIRDFYLRHLREAMAEVRKDPEAKLIVEGVLRNPEGEVVSEGLLDLPMRVDIVVTRAGQVVDSYQVKAAHELAIKPFTFPWTGGASITAGPFQWEECKFRLPGIGREANFKPLADWFMAWFDQDDERGLYYSDLQGVVHCLTDPKFDDEGATFSIDFGSAPADVFEYLLDALEQVGAKTVQIGNVGEQPQQDGKQ
jgi:hypothetical protein